MDFLRFLAELRTPFGDAFFGFVTHGGEELILMGIMCICYWCIDKRFAYRLAFPYFFAGVTVQGLKVICRVPRPWIKDPNFKPVESAVAAATGYSFPSGHTFSATVLCTSFALKTKKIAWRVLWFVCMILVMLSRMYLGCHTPQDVLVSCAICLTITIVCNKLIDKIKVTDKNRIYIALAVAGYTLITLIYSGILYLVDYVTLDNTQDVFKTAGAGLAFAICWYIETKKIDFNPKACSLPMQVLKVAIGVVGLLAFKEGMKPIIGESLIANFFRYFMMVFWAMGAYPVLIKRFFNK